MLDPHIVLPTVVIVGLAALVHGYGGFGFGMTCMTLFALLPRDLERLAVVATIAAGAIVGTLLACSWKDSRIAWRRLALLLGGTLAGQPAGYWFIRNFTDHPILRITFAIILLLFAANGLRGPHRARTLPVLLALPVGLLSGFVAGAFVAGGPPVVLYLYSQTKDPRDMKATIQVFFCCGVVYRLMLVAVMGGGFTSDVLLLSAWAVPLSLIMVCAGHILSKRVTVAQFQKYVYATIGALAIVISTRAVLTWIEAGRHT